MACRTANQSGLVTLTFDLLILKVVSESRVTCSTSVPILVFLGLSVLELRPMYATDVKQTHVRRQTDRRQNKASLNASAHIRKYGKFHYIIYRTDKITLLLVMAT